MPKINVYLPDDLAEQVKARELPVSAICQEALREELARMQTIERAEDIKVFVRPKGDNPYGEDPSYDPGVEVPDTEDQAVLVYKPGSGFASSGGTWSLGISDPDWEIYEFGGSADSASDIEAAVDHARDHIRRDRQPAMEEITVGVGEQGLRVAFEGRWLIEPNMDDTRTGERGHDAGAYYGVALTRRGRIAVYAAHVNDRWAPALTDYDTLDDAGADNIPADILALAAAELGEERAIWRDI